MTDKKDWPLNKLISGAIESGESVELKLVLSQKNDRLRVELAIQTPEGRIYQAGQQVYNLSKMTSVALDGVGNCSELLIAMAHDRIMTDRAKEESASGP